MSKIYYVETNKYTINLINTETSHYVSVSGFSSNDGSAYLTINSGEKINYAKFSYHPQERRFHYAFTDELWKMLDKAGKGKPNSEKIKSKIVDVEGTQIMCCIFLDKSSLYRRGVVKNNGPKIDFPNNKVFKISFALEGNIPVVTHNFFDARDTWDAEMDVERNKIYLLNDKIRSSKISGIAQLMNDSEFPWEMLCIGI